jgi:hypothetical protein
MFNAKTVNNLLSIEECNTIIELVKGIEPWEGEGTGLWSNRSLNAVNIYDNYDKEVGYLLYSIRERIANELKSHYGLPEIYPDLFQVNRWLSGMKQAPHADDMTNSRHIHDDWYKHREFGTIIYLNDNYSGGHTYYPEHGFDITPEAGKLAMHPGDPEHLHGVTEIQDSTRYTIVAFWTQDPQHFDGWTL